MFVHTQAHERVRGCVSEGERERVGGPAEAVGFLSEWKPHTRRPIRLTLILSLSSRPTAKDDCFLASFLSRIQPSGQHLLLPTVLFERLQRGNISTAFQAQAFLWLCLSSTRHSAVVLHRQAPHSML